MTHQLGDKPVQPEYIEKMREVVRGIDDFFNQGTRGKDRKTGFVLLVFPFGGPEKGDNRCNFMSNGADRKDIVILMKEMIARFEGQPEVSGSA